MNESKIKLVRFKTGEDIIGFITDIDDSHFNIKNPMLIDIVMDTKTMTQSFVMKPWLPHQLYKNDEVTIWTNDTLFSSEANDEFIDYFNSMVEKIQKFIAAEDIMNNIKDDELYDALIELDNGASIH